MDDFYTKLKTISVKTGLPIKKLLDFLFYLKSGAPLENSVLISKLGISKNVLNEVKVNLSSYLNKPSKVTQLKEDSRKLVTELFNSGYRTEENMFSFNEDEQYKNTLSLLNKYQKDIPPTERKYDQFTATRDTVAKRASLLNYFADLNGKRLLFLGDDDLTSLAATSYGSAAEIAVIDIDQRILDIITKIAQREHLFIETDKYDIRNELPKNFKKQFDVVFTDPPYTTEGIRLFLSRAIDALDINNLSGRIYLCFGNSDQAKERYLPIMNIFTSMGLMVRWAFDKFNRYQGAESIGNTSTLYILDTTPKTNSSIKGSYNGKLYTNN
jgi:predicted methyltransferase